MKSTCTNFKLFLIVLTILLGTNSLMAQTVINVPAEFPRIWEALDAVRNDLEKYPPETPILIRVHGAGYSVYDPESATTNQAYINMPQLSQRGYNITIEGDGPDKTVIRGFATPEDMPDIRHGGHDDRGIRFLTTHANGPGWSFTLKNIKLQNWGYGNASGGIININQASTGGMKVTMINVEFEYMMATAGAIVQSNMNNNELYMDNVFIHNSTVYENTNFQGLFHLRRIGKLTVKNSTFMSNDRYSRSLANNNDLARNTGTIFRILHTDHQENQNLTILFENNAFIDNLPVDIPRHTGFSAGGVTLEPTPTHIAQPLISFEHIGAADKTSVIDITMKNNIMIENRREGQNMDVDILVLDTQGIEGRIIFNYPEVDNYNIVNSIVVQNELVEATPVNYWTYNDLRVDGYKISRAYTYTDPDIAFEMEGDLPKVFYDEHGVGFVQYSGDGGVPSGLVTSITLSAPSAFVAPGATLQITAEVLPEDAIDKSLTWEVEYGTGIAILINDSGLLQGLVEGSVAVIARANDGSGVMGTLEITVGVDDNTSVNDQLAPRLFVYPNPVRETMNIASDVVIDEVRIINVIGQMVYSTSVNDKTVQLPVGDIKEGVYLVQIAAGDSIQIKRVIISR
jgi:hypothetical protein